MTDANPPKPPPGLIANGPGKRLWLSVTERFEPEPDELLVLESACRTADELFRLDRELRKATTLETRGYRRQSRANPLLKEARQHRLLLSRLLAQLGLESSSPAASRSAAARKLALVRWNGRGDLAG